MIAETQQLALLSRLREALAKTELTLQENRWLGWNAAYRFSCPQGHVSARAGTQIIRFVIQCPVCRKASHAREKLMQLRQVAERAGGECLSETYLGSDKEYRFRCRQGHYFAMRGGHILEGHWCSRCACKRHSEKMRDAHGLEKLKEVVRQRGGEYLSEVYTKKLDRYRFRCAAGHEWTTRGAEVLRGAWCPLCAAQAKSKAYRRKDGLEALQKIAQAQGGKCLADEYQKSNTRYRFCCASGHEWETKGGRIFRGAWCPTCARKKNRLTIETMRETAIERGGRCLSETYVNTSTKLEWECHRGHRWWALPASIRRGHWCRECAILERITKPKTRRLRRYEAVSLQLDL